MGTSAGDKTPRTTSSSSMAMPEHHMTSSSGAQDSSLSEVPACPWLVTGVTLYIIVHMLASGTLLLRIMPDGCEQLVEAACKLQAAARSGCHWAGHGVKSALPQVSPKRMWAVAMSRSTRYLQFRLSLYTTLTIVD